MKQITHRQGSFTVVHESDVRYCRWCSNTLEVSAPTGNVASPLKFTVGKGTVTNGSNAAWREESVS